MSDGVAPSKGAWTPGPWFVVHDELCEEPWNYDVCAETPSIDKMLVARVRIVPPDGDVAANALLISKSPQMAELIRCIVEWEADYRRINNLSGHPEWVGRAERLLSELEVKP